MTNITTADNASSAPGVGGVFSYYDLENADLIRTAALEAMWGETFNHDATVATLNMIGNSGKFGGKRSMKSKTVKWGVGDYLHETLSLSSATVTYTYGSAVSLIVETRGLLEGDLILVVDSAGTVTDHSAGTSSTQPAWILVRVTGITTLTTVAGTVEAASVFLDTADTIVFTKATTTIVKTAPALNYDREARPFLNVKPDVLENYMQHASDTVGRGQWERSVDVIADYSLTHLVRLANKHFFRKMNNMLYVNKRAVQAGSGEEDYGITGGFSYFFNPESYVESGATWPERVTPGTGYVANYSYQGVNLAVSEVLFTDLARYMSQLTQYGSKNKIMFASSLMVLDILDEAMTDSTVRVMRETITGLKNVLYPDLWQAYKLDLGYGSLTLITDNGMSQLYQRVASNITAAATGVTKRVDSTYSNKFGVIVDVEEVALIYMETTEGVQSPKIVDVNKYRNSTLDEMEMDAGFMLAIGDPRTGGYFAVGTEETEYSFSA